MISHCACPTRVFRDRALHEHRRASSLPSHAPSHPFLSGRDDMMDSVSQIEILTHTFERESWP